MTTNTKFENSFAQALPEMVAPHSLTPAADPKMVKWNDELAERLGLQALSERADIWTGSAVPEGAKPVAMAYAGHQFGGFSPKLGDGRAFLLGEVIDNNGLRQDIHLKGSGLTPFSRMGTDGKAVIGPVLREYLMGEAMHALGVPTTRALAAATTGEEVYRDGMKPGAVLTRVADGHIRVGSFQYLAAMGESDLIRALADYAIERHFPDLQGRDDQYLAFLVAVCERQALLLAKWMSIGFVHGVMNTDNMAISGETIDYGPCAFLDVYDPQTVFSSIDRQGRYAFGNQPIMAQWNLARFAETLLPLLNEDQDEAVALAETALSSFVDSYVAHWSEMMANKIGFIHSNESSMTLINSLLEIMTNGQADFTRTFRALGDDEAFVSGFGKPDEAALWLKDWKEKLPDPDLEKMRLHNPLYIPRNHLVDEALRQAEAGDLTAFHALLDVLHTPYDAQIGKDEYAQPAPADFGRFVTFCGT